MSNARLPQYDTKLFTEIWDTAAEFVSDYQTVGIPTTISTQNATTLYYLLYARYGNTPIANYDETQWKYKMFSIVFQYGPTWEKRLSVQQTLRGLSLSDLTDNGSMHELFEHEASGTAERTTSGTAGKTDSGSTTSTGTVTVDTDSTTDVDHDNRIDTDNDTEDIKNHAYNPNTTPASDAYSPLAYINEQHATKNVLDGSSVQDETSSTTVDGTQLTTNNLAGTSSLTSSSTTSGSDNVENSDESTNETTTTLTTGKLKAYEKLLELLQTDVTGEFINKFKICFKQFVMPERTWIYVTDNDEEDDE